MVRIFGKPSTRAILITINKIVAHNTWSAQSKIMLHRLFKKITNSVMTVWPLNCTGQYRLRRGLHSQFRLRNQYNKARCQLSACKLTARVYSSGSSVSQNKLPQLILGYIYILKYLESNFIG